MRIDNIKSISFGQVHIDKNLSANQRNKATRLLAQIPEVEGYKDVDKYGIDIVISSLKSGFGRFGQDSLLLKFVKREDSDAALAFFKNGDVSFPQEKLKSITNILSGIKCQFDKIRSIEEQFKTAEKVLDLAADETWQKNQALRYKVAIDGFEYDTKNKSASKRTKTPDGMLFEKFNYDRPNVFSQERYEYYPDGKLASKTIIEEEAYDDGKNFLEERVVKYDNKGRLTLESRKGNDKFYKWDAERIYNPETGKVISEKHDMW